MTSRQQAAERSLEDQNQTLPRRQVILVFFSLAFALLVAFVDQNGIGVTLPTIARDLHAEDTISWAGTSSLIANAAFQMLYGRLSDIFGRKVVYMTAISCLAAAALLCGFSRNDTMFYVFRAVAGIGSGGLINLSMIIVSDVVTLKQRASYMGYLGCSIGLGNVAGPFLAATFITSASWRTFFWTIAALATALGGIALYTLPLGLPTRNLKEKARQIDYGGILLSTTGIIFLLIPISGGGAYFPWASPMVITMLTLGSILLLLFVVWEWRMARLPMIPMQIFRNLDVSILLGQNFLFGSAYQALLYYLPLYIQNARQYSVMQSACIVAVPVGAQAVSTVLAGNFISYVKRWKEVISVGYIFWTLGASLMLLYERDTSMGVIVGPLVILGTGVGLSFQPTLVALQTHATKSRRAVIISTRNFFRCVGGSAGLAISAAILQAVLKSNLPPNYQHLADNAYSPPRIDGPDAEAVYDAYMAASRAVFILQIPLMGICFLGCLFVKDHGLHSLDEQEKETADGGSTEKSDVELSEKIAATPINLNNGVRIVVGEGGLHH
ncbi:major facilitator superfamily domain-containing protein [Nemania sp. NC0429]|nr:major facilitator superfamily domain-containing protein [Nemania sp. NC0429]